MKPLFSDEERTQAVKNFIVALYHNQAKISSFARIVLYLNEKRIKPLRDLKKSGRGEPISLDESGEIYSYKDVFTQNDAEAYFDWLVAVVTGAESVSDNNVKQANDQLFQFIHVLGDSVRMEKNVQLIAPYDWQALFTSFDKRLAGIQNIIDKGDKDIVEVLKPILEMMKRNIKLLDVLQKENERVFGKGNTL